MFRGSTVTSCDWLRQPPPPIPFIVVPIINLKCSGLAQAGGRGEKSPHMLLQIASPHRGAGSCLRVLLFLFSLLSLMSVSALSPPARWMSMGLSCSRLGGKAGNYLPPIDVSCKWPCCRRNNRLYVAKTIAIFLGFYAEIVGGSFCVWCVLVKM